jgi:hypothetical protein
MSHGLDDRKLVRFFAMGIDEAQKGLLDHREDLLHLFIAAGNLMRSLFVLPEDAEGTDRTVAVAEKSLLQILGQRRIVDIGRELDERSCHHRSKIQPVMKSPEDPVVLRNGKILSRVRCGTKGKTEVATRWSPWPDRPEDDHLLSGQLLESLNVFHDASPIAYGVANRLCEVHQTFLVLSG